MRITVHAYIHPYSPSRLQPAQRALPGLPPQLGRFTVPLPRPRLHAVGGGSVLLKLLTVVCSSVGR